MDPRHCIRIALLFACLAAASSAHQSGKWPDAGAKHAGHHSKKHATDGAKKWPEDAHPEPDYDDDEADGVGGGVVGDADANYPSAGSDGSGEVPTLPTPGTYVPSNCSTCARREELRRRSLEVIKDQILSKLGMQQAPNITGRLPPRIPPLDHLLDMYGMQGDAPGGGPFQPGPVYDEEEDDFHARTEKVIAFAQQRESHVNASIHNRKPLNVRQSDA